MVVVGSFLSFILFVAYYSSFYFLRPLSSSTFSFSLSDQLHNESDMKQMKKPCIALVFARVWEYRLVYIRVIRSTLYAFVLLLLLFCLNLSCLFVFFSFHSFFVVVLSLWKPYDCVILCRIKCDDDILHIWHISALYTHFACIYSARLCTNSSQSNRMASASRIFYRNDAHRNIHASESDGKLSGVT